MATATAPAAPAPAATSDAPPPALSVPVPVTPEAPPEALQPDLFETAFAEAIKADAPPAPEAATPKKPKTAPAPQAPTPTPAEPEPAQPVAPAEPVAPQPTSPPAPTQPVAPTPAPVQQPAPPQPQPAPVAHQEPPLFNQQEAAIVSKLYEDWPDVAKPVETMIRGLMTQVTRRMYADIAAGLAPHIQLLGTLADRAQLSELQSHVPDYTDILTKLPAWAASQPAYLRAAYEGVIKHGTAEEVADLINNRYRPAQSPPPTQGNAPAATAPAVSSAPAPAPVNPALAAAAARLAPVATKRTNVVAPPADFDTAFAEFAKAS